MTEIPEDIAQILMRALVWCGSAVTREQADKAWRWIEEHRGNVEEMGGWDGPTL